ncbi:MAG TPA: DUF5627 domain-containing protein [Paludibacter sp.]|nr:DUF5627 domain-containing protein [Paludibacter sp.]
MKKMIFIFLVAISLLTACQNQDMEYSDYKYSTVYFSYQSPVRTIVLGTDYAYDNSLDNDHQCMVYATMGGVYVNKTNRTLDVVVDNSLCANLTFDDATGAPVLPMPSSYYTLPSNMQIVIPAGQLMGGLKVQLTDAFFADPLACKTNYVIPLRITKVAAADSILSGSKIVANPNRFVASDWSILPKDYVLYAVKYKNQWDAAYLRRGTESSSDTTVVYHKKYVEYDQVVSGVTTQSMNQLLVSLNAKTHNNADIPFQLQMLFDNNGNCTLTNPASATYSVTGTGKYVKNGDSWGNQKRDVLYLNYNVTFGAVTHTMTDTMVLRDRVEKFETFKPFYNN